ncbi:MAG: hypothetical protein ACJ757_12245 [Gaiellaceae bacterium]
MGNLIKSTIGAATLVLVVAGTALAAGGDGAGPYAGTAGTVQTALQATKKTGTTLPFTGTNLSIVLAIALGLGLAGFAIRRSGRERA